MRNARRTSTVLVAALAAGSLLFGLIPPSTVLANGTGHVPARVTQATGGYLVRANIEAPLIILGPPLQFEASPTLVMVIDAEHDVVLLDLRFTDPDDGDQIRITFVQPIPFALQGSVVQGTVSPNMNPDPAIFQGGVAFDMTHHGDTGIGIADFPAVKTTQAFWGFVDVFTNDVKVATTVGHIMVLEDGIREDATNELRVPPTPDAGRQGLGGEIHFMILPHPLMESLGLEPPDPLLPNEALMEPFIHVNFDKDDEIAVLVPQAEPADEPGVSLLTVVLVVVGVGAAVGLGGFLAGRRLRPKA